MRYRITVRRDSPLRTELRGFIDGDEALTDLADALAALDPVALVIASPVEPDWNPWTAFMAGS